MCVDLRQKWLPLNQTEKVVPTMKRIPLGPVDDNKLKYAAKIQNWAPLYHVIEFRSSKPIRIFVVFGMQP